MSRTPAEVAGNRARSTDVDGGSAMETSMRSTVPEDLSIERGVPGLVGRMTQTIWTRRSYTNTNSINAKSEAGHPSLDQHQVEARTEREPKYSKRTE